MKYASALSFPKRKTLKDILPSPTINLVGKKICEDIEESVGPDASVLIVGCGEGGEGLSGFSEDFLDKNITGLDIRKTDFTEIKGDVHQMPIKSECFDAVICQATLEHIEDVNKALDEITRVIKKSGLLYIDMPFIQGYHALPTDYRRYTKNGLENTIKNKADFETIDSGTSKGPTSTLVWIMCEYLGFLFSFGNYKVRKALSAGLRILTFWLKYLDKLLIRTHGFDGKAMSIPSAVYWYGKKT